ncbi:MAG TPA: biopolymer transporter ExbD [Pyrinomonadaceae bacterium]|nr:biopolymer transporter ExbD [Pyrinomonadaceae bacterium]
MKVICLNLGLLFILIVIFFVFGCFSNNSSPNNLTNKNSMDNQTNFNESVVARVKVTQTGKIYLNEKPVSLMELKKAFAQLKRENGVVWYYRENPQSEPSSEATSVIQAIIDAKLPVQLSSKPDYSDFVDIEGKSNPINK